MSPEQDPHDGRPGAADESAPNEIALKHAMHAATRGLHPPTADLVRGGLERGRRMRAVRRVQIAGAALAVAVAAGSGALIATTGSHASGPTGTAHQPPPSGRESVPPTSPTPLPPSAPLAGSAAMKVLTLLLPPGDVTDRAFDKQPDNVTRSVTISARFWPVDGSAPGYVAMTFGEDAAPIPNLACRQDAPVGESCELRTLPDGSRLRLTKEYMGPTPQGFTPAGGEVMVATATLARPDNMMIYILAANSPNPQAYKVSPQRVDPVLSVAQLEAIVTSPAWEPLTGPGALPDDPAGVPTSTPSPPTTSAPPETADKSAGKNLDVPTGAPGGVASRSVTTSPPEVP
ncbi:hypothetical protein [Streptodolium elevatio]|uniref:Uncharacterized protein n=1 Tax=Streptodolium elevatio TaxID=3157996 RepID=A0ABV3DWX8_9ACTN